MFEEALVCERWQEGPRYMGLRVKVSAELAEAYERSGQYVMLRIGEGPARFYVIASRPGPRIWEFLIAMGGDLGPALAALEVGDLVLVSAPEGTGFDASEAVGKRALLFCTGSGVATMRPLIEEWLEGAERPDEIALYYGEARQGDFGYEELLERWKAQGVKLYRVVEEGASEDARYVQEVFAAHHPPLEDAYFYVSGAPVMIEMAARRIFEFDVEPWRVKVNI